MLICIGSSMVVFGKKTSETDTEKIDIGGIIMHHIKDAHEFHIGGDLSLPLPVILWTDNGIVTFMSSAFAHNDDGTVVVESGEQRFVKYHEKIFYAGATGKVEFDENGKPINSKPMDFSITKNVFSMFMSMAILMFVFFRARKSYSSTGVPKGIAKFIEPLILFVRDDIARPMIGERKYAKFLPYLLTLFFFIWINNIIGLIPFFPFSANLSGNISFTTTLALFTFFITQFNGNKNYWQHIFWMPGVAWPMKIFLAIIELIGVFVKPFSLLMRLFANITAGHIVILSITALIFVFKNLYGIWGGLGISVLSVVLVVFIGVIEVAVIAIQAYIFTILSALYFGMATEESHH